MSRDDIAPDDLISLVPRLIRYGHENARTRHEIVTESGYTDRFVRRIIEAARDAGWLVCNDQDGRGYYLGWTTDEIERQYWRDQSRALSILKRQKAFRRHLKEAGRPVKRRDEHVDRA